MATKQVPTVLIVEDDPEQMDLLVRLAQNQIQWLMSDDELSEQECQILKKIQIVKARDIDSLKRAVLSRKNILFVALDCNLPDVKGNAPHDQLIKTNYRITGQHKSIDIILKGSPSTEICIISSFYRFDKLVTQYYKNKHNLDIHFILKNKQQNIVEYFSQALKRSVKEKNQSQELLRQA